ncbi:MAG: polysaccharide deacetylase family protein [bacterium]
MLFTSFLACLLAASTAVPHAGSTLGRLPRPAAAGELAGRTIIFSVDDGYHSVYANIYPLLRRYRVPLTLGVIGDYLRGGTPRYEPSAGYMRRSEIRELIDSCGIEVASHSLSHAYLTRLDSAAAWREIRGSKVLLESLFGGEVITFVYPYGDLNDRVVRQVRAAGYRLGRAVRPGRVDFHHDPWRLPIVELRLETGLEDIKQAIRARRVTILLLHQVVEEPRYFTQWPLEDFTRLLEWLDAGGARVTTLRQLYREWWFDSVERILADAAAAFPDRRKRLLFENVQVDATQAPHPR